MNREKLVVILVILAVLFFCAWVSEWDRPIITWASDKRATSLGVNDSCLLRVV